MPRLKQPSKKKIKLALNSRQPRKSERKKDKDKFEKDEIDVLVGTPLGKQLIADAVQLNADEIQRTIEKCRLDRNLQNSRLSLFATPLKKQHYVMKEVMLSKYNDLDNLPFERKLEHIIGYVDVWCLGLNRSREVKNIIMAMGGKVVETFSILVSHVIFQEGSDDTYKLGISNRCQVVSVLWLGAVKQSSFRVPEICFDSLQQYATSDKISAICEINDNTLSDDSLKSSMDACVKRLKQCYIPSEYKDYTLELINGTVKKVRNDQRVIRNDNLKTITRKHFTAEDDIKIDATSEMKKDDKIRKLDEPEEKNVLVTNVKKLNEIEVRNNITKTDKKNYETLNNVNVSNITSTSTKDIYGLDNKSRRNNMNKSNSRTMNRRTICNTKVGLENVDNKQVNHQEILETPKTPCESKQVTPKYRKLYTPVLENYNFNQLNLLKENSRTMNRRTICNTKVGLENVDNKQVNHQEILETPKTLPESEQVRPKYRKLYTPVLENYNFNQLNLLEENSRTMNRRSMQNSKVGLENHKNKEQVIAQSQLSYHIECKMGHLLTCASSENGMPGIAINNSSILSKLEAAVELLGRFTLTANIVDNTTHLIILPDIVTFSVFKGITNGCWILPYDWLLKSIEEGKWLPEQQFELNNLYPSARENRILRQAIKEKCKVFQGYKPFYLSPDLYESWRLQKLIEYCGGNVSGCINDCWATIGWCAESKDIPCLSKDFIFDYIEHNKTFLFNNYILKSRK